MFVGSVRLLYTRWRHLRRRIRHSVSAASSPTITHQAVTSRQQWHAWRGSNISSVVGGGGMKLQDSMFRPANPSPRTLTRINCCNLTLGGHRISSNPLVGIHWCSPFMSTHPLLVPGLITHIPNDRQPGDCTWDSLFDGLPPVRPSGINEGTAFKLGESVISRSGDTCSEGSWVFYNTRNVCLIPLFPTCAQPPIVLACDPFKRRTGP